MEKKNEIKNWEKIVRDWESSGLSQAKYCNKNGIKVSTFIYHRKNLEISTGFSNPAKPAVQELVLPVRRGVFFEFVFDKLEFTLKLRVKL